MPQGTVTRLMKTQDSHDYYEKYVTNNWLLNRKELRDLEDSICQWCIFCYVIFNTKSVQASVESNERVPSSTYLTIMGFRFTSVTVEILETFSTISPAIIKFRSLADRLKNN